MRLLFCELIWHCHWMVKGVSKFSWARQGTFNTFCCCSGGCRSWCCSGGCGSCCCTGGSCCGSWCCRRRCCRSYRWWWRCFYFTIARKAPCYNVLINDKPSSSPDLPASPVWPGTLHIFVLLIDQAAAVGALGVACDVPGDPDVGGEWSQSEFVRVLVICGSVQVFWALQAKTSEWLRLSGGG